MVYVHKLTIVRTHTRASRGVARLLAVLQEIAQADAAELVSSSRYGQKYRVRAIVEKRGAKPLSLVTVWIVRHDEDFPRFITAYPGAPR